jgi:hypothetical protein
MKESTLIRFPMLQRSRPKFLRLCAVTIFGALQKWSANWPRITASVMQLTVNNAKRNG